MRYLYSFFLYLCLPFLAFSLLKRYKRIGKDKFIDTFKKRFGFSFANLPKNAILIHAVSAGETRSIIPLIVKIQKQHPTTPIIITCGSQNGCLQLNQVFKEFSNLKLASSIICYDLMFSVKNMLKTLKPKAIVIIETEIWPNLYCYAKKYNIPLLIANIRLKKQSFYQYLKIKPFIKQTLNHADYLGAQSATDKARLEYMGAKRDKVEVMGNLKYDIKIANKTDSKIDEWHQNLKNKKTLIFAISTHKGEEEILLKAFNEIKRKKAKQNFLLVIAPRHPDRFIEVKNLLANQSISFGSFSELEDFSAANNEVLVVDTFGKVIDFIRVSDICFIGGTMVEFGGHNILEVAANKKPLISGSFYKNLEVLYKSFKQKKAIVIVKDADELVNSILEIIDNPLASQRQIAAAYKCFKGQQGATEKLYLKIKDAL